MKKGEPDISWRP